MAEPFLSEIKIMSFNFAPRGWASCDGQTLQIAQNQALFSLLGTTYGGNGQTTFQLPDLRGRTPLHFGGGFTLGQRAGEPTHTLGVPEIAAHTHVPSASSAPANAAAPGGNFWAPAGKNNFAGASQAALAPEAIATVGGSQAHENMSPYLTLNFCIALQGIFPSPN